MRTRIAIVFSSALFAVVVTVPRTSAQPEPKTAREFVERGGRELQNREFAAALKDFTEAIRLDPKSASARSGRGIARVETGDPLNGLNDCAEAIRLDPTNPRGYYGRGRARERLGWTAKAIEDFTEAIRLDPKYAPAFHGRAIALQGEGKREKALADYSEAIRLSPNTAMFYNDRATAHLAARTLDKAIADCTEAIRLDPRCAEAYRNRADARFQQRAVDKALADLNEAVRLDPRNAAFLLDRSRCRVAEGSDLSAALADAEEAIRLMPKDPVALGQRAGVRFALGEWAAVRADLDDAIRLGPNAADLYVARANLLACCPDPKLHDAAQAFKDADRACELTGWKDPYALEALAAAAAALGDFSGALKWQKKALEDTNYARFALNAAARLAAYEAKRAVRFAPPIRDRGDPRQFVARGDHYFVTGEYDSAVRDYDVAIRLDPKNAKAFYGRGCARARLAQETKALADFTEALRLDPKDVSALVDRSVIRVLRGEWELALADCDAALALDPKHVSALTHRAMIRASSADPTYRDAAKALEDARRACDLTGWKVGYPLEGYAAACAEAGDFDEAVKWQVRAAADEEYGQRRGAILRYHLQLFQAKKPLRQGTPRKAD